ncbi:restriction endonuclease subunit S [Aequorivita sinensis]|uniref:restriction endonuclease subunit S n=1 Tax=Aequorivita sinensis TaxID=1382458 RepID=UPI002300057A|nr:restriction endonuclease subunit S [Aequorivita sinensis]
MRSNYKRLGDYIKVVNKRNKKLEVETLLGVSIRKVLMPSIANTIGTNMTTYKIIKRNQFAYGPVTSRNGDKISIAILDEYDEAIVSQAYTVFKIIDENALSPEYLMMWFRRPEFDRYARYKSHGSAREIFGWDEMLETELPIPSIEIQQEIVNEYQTITKRIQLNEQLNQKLEETAQALYKHWFVDFEFPNENGKPYKFSGGAMVYNEELDGEVPEGWDVEPLHKHIDVNVSNFSKDDIFDFIKYYDTSSITQNVFSEPQILDFKTDVIPSRAKRKVKHNDLLYSTVRPNLRHYGLVKNPSDNTLVSTGFVVMSNTSDYINNEFLLLLLSDEGVINYFQSKAEMSVSTYPSIKPEDLLEVVFPFTKEQDLFKKFNLLLTHIFDSNEKRDRENLTLEKLKNLFLSKMATVEN